MGTFTTQPAAQSVTAGQTASFTVVASGTAPLIYQWKKSGANILGATSGTYTTPDTSSADIDAVLAYSVVVSNSAGTVTSNEARLTVTATAVAPSINTQPAAQTVTEGQTASFSVEATGTGPLAYQWQKNGTAIDGATSSTYTTPATTIGDTDAVFTVVVSNGTGTATSSSATLTVTAGAVALAITSQPAAQTVTEGQPATFSVTATGTEPLSYQWKKNGTAIDGATSSTYTTPTTAIGDTDAVFTVVVSNGTGTATSSNATLTVTPVSAPVAPTITTHPASQSVVAGQSATFSVVANGSATLAYQWQKNDSKLDGATSSTYTLPATSLADSGAQYSVVVTNGAGTVTSDKATLTVTAAPVAPTITTQPVAQTVTVGAAASFSVVATGTGQLAYQWKKNDSDIAGATSSTFTTPATSLADSGAQYSVVVSNGVGTATSNKVSLTVSAAAPSITTQPASQSVAVGGTVTFSVVATGTGPLLYQWKKVNTLIPGATSSSYTTATITSADHGAQFAVVVSNSAGTTTSNYATLTVASNYSLVPNTSGGTYATTECVKDTSTNLFWEGKPTSGTRAATNTYTNYDDTTKAQKPSGNPSAGDLSASTNSRGYVAAVNALALCGFADWRMPTDLELWGLVDSSQSPAINNFWFPNTQVANNYWTSTPLSGYDRNARVGFFYNTGGLTNNPRDGGVHIRLVRP